MPTPFYHLSVASDLLAHPDLPSEIKNLLVGQQCAFFLGNTAPDVQTLSGQRRDDTHFFGIPPEVDPPPWDVMLNAHPEIARADALHPAHAAFVAGYLCHLQADISWVINIFSPIFWEQKEWEDFQRRLFYHNVLRTYLDEKVLPGLPEDISSCLSSAAPYGWLPFVEDVYLKKWRDYLAEQLAPGAQTQTIEVFAQRQGISVEEFLALVHSEDRMDVEIFAHVPRQILEDYRHKLLQDNVQLLLKYLDQTAD